MSPVGARFCPACGVAVPADATVREERKVVTVLFADLVGFTARSEMLDPEDVRALVRPFHDVLRREVEAFGGTLARIVGDAGMAVFGYPVAHEDDPERAVRAALAIQASLRDLDASTARGRASTRGSGSTPPRPSSRTGASSRTRTTSWATA